MGSFNRSMGPLYRIAAVSFLNSRPLVEGLAECPDIDLCFDVPSRLPAMLEENRVDAALVPVVDLLWPDRRWVPISDACIGCDGETMTVRVFSRMAPDRITRLAVDPASHTSVLLARLIWRRLYGISPGTHPLAAGDDPGGHDAVLLIGDRVVADAPYGFTYQMDLGGAWKALTGLPFVFAVWAAHEERASEPLGRLLSSARDRGVARAAEIAAEEGPGRGWPPAVAKTYLTRNLSFRVTERHREGLHTFFRWAAAEGIAPEPRGSVLA